MIKVKLINPYHEVSLEKQTPNSKGVWGNYQFFENSNIKKYDYCVICEKVNKNEKITCPKNNIIFITGEPSSIKKYNHNFLKQFGVVVSPQKEIRHLNKIYKQILPWSIGTRRKKGQALKVVMDYDKIKNTKITKQKLLSIIVSAKKMTVGHKKRLEFVNKLKRHFGEKIDIFGAKINFLPLKWDGISPYKYHIAIENSSHKDYWTEKLADAFLGEAYPIYYGCPNIYDYFSKNSLTTIDINKPEEAIKIIENTIDNNQYEKSKKYILESKNLILDKYNLFPMICHIIENNIKKQDLNIREEIIEIKPESYYKNKFHKKIIAKFFSYIKIIKLKWLNK